MIIINQLLMVAPQFNHQNYVIAEAPSNPLLNIPFKYIPYKL